jgi:hypothetical protein
LVEHHESSPAHHRGIQEWAAWVEAHPEPSTDWRDRFYWEQRAAGWLAAVAQGLDVVDAESIPPANCKSIITTMLQIERAKRRGKRGEVDRVAPFLTDYPSALGEPQAVRLRRGASAIFHHPSKPSFVRGRVRSMISRARAAHRAGISPSGSES